MFNIDNILQRFTKYIKKKKASKTSLTAFEIIYLLWDDEDREKLQ